MMDKLFKFSMCYKCCVNRNFTIYNVHSITCGNMASNADREVDEVREERLEEQESITNWKRERY